MDLKQTVADRVAYVLAKPHQRLCCDLQKEGIDTVQKTIATDWENLSSGSIVFSNGSWINLVTKYEPDSYMQLEDRKVQGYICNFKDQEMETQSTKDCFNWIKNISKEHLPIVSSQEALRDLSKELSKRGVESDLRFIEDVGPAYKEYIDCIFVKNSGEISYSVPPENIENGKIDKEFCMYGKDFYKTMDEVIHEVEKNNEIKLSRDTKEPAHESVSLSR